MSSLGWLEQYAWTCTQSCRPSVPHTTPYNTSSSGAKIEAMYCTSTCINSCQYLMRESKKSNSYGFIPTSTLICNSADTSIDTRSRRCKWRRTARVLVWRRRMPWVEQDGEWELERLLLEWGKSGHPSLRG